MTTNHLRLSTIMLCILLLAAACHRDEGAVTLTMSVESMSGGGKMTLNENVSSWDTGDSVWVNGTAYAVSTDGGSTSVTVPYSDNGYRAIFPARIARNGGNEIVLPAEYHYRTNANGQLLDMPLVAASENSTLLFKHITGALMVKLRNDNSFSLSLDRIIVSSDQYALSGTRPINFNDIASSSLPQAGSDDERNVSLCFDRQELTLNSGDSVYVMIPVAAVGDSNHFTITVRSHHEGTRYTATKTQTKGGSLSSNTLAYATMALDGTQSAEGLFDINDSQEYIIRTAEDFRNMVYAINQKWLNITAPYSNAKYIIAYNIDMSGVTVEPITGYTGASIHGYNHTIRNLTISSNSAVCALIDTLKYGSTLSALNLQGIRLVSNGTYNTRIISPLIGHVASEHTFSNFTISMASVTINGNPSGDIYFGGLVATGDAALSFSNCHFSGDVTLSSRGKLYYGGLLAATTTNNSPNLTITSCSNTDTNHANLTAEGLLYAGGLIGDAKVLHNTIDNQICLINFSLGGNRIFAGGLIGNLTNSNNSSLVIRNTIKVAGIISFFNAHTDCYIGTLYGRGRPFTQYDLRQDRNYDASEMTIPENQVPNSNIHTGNPSYQ